MAALDFTVHGLPRPQGSACWRPTPGGKVAIIPSRASTLWRERVAAAAEVAMGGQALLEGAVRVEVDFRLPRPGCHYGTGRNASTVRAGAPAWPAGRPDVDKLVRAVLDGLTSTVLVDDALVVELVARKVWVGRGQEGATIRVEELGELERTSGVEEAEAGYLFDLDEGVSVSEEAS